MSCSLHNFPQPSTDLPLWPDRAAAHWYAAYTLPRHEKAVQEQLKLRSVESYLPLYNKRSRWKDRIARLVLPLFPGYVFVRIPLMRRVGVLGTPGIVRLVGFNGRPAAIPDEEIESLRKFLSLRAAEPSRYLSAGKRVRVLSGPLEGLEGVVVRRKNACRIVVSIDSIQRAVAFEVAAADLQPTS
jgi:transcription antitermination factor NusG